MSARERSVVTDPASSLTVPVRVSGSLASTFLRMAPMTMRWFAVR